jgi:PAS domain S-box-containing protein
MPTETVLVRAAEALHKQQENQRFILDHLSVGVVLADIAGTAFYQNPTFSELFGYTQEQFPTLAAWWLLAHPEPSYREQVVAEWNCRLAEALKGRGEIRPMEVAITCSDGTEKWVCVSARVIDDFLVVTFIDLTERKAVEDQVSARESRYRDLYENSPVAYFSVGPDARIRRCNRQAAAMLGFTVEQVEGRLVFELYADTPHGKAKASQVFRRFLAGEPVADEELQMMTADGTLIWISLSVTAIRDDAGKVLESRSAVLDITERKEAEALLEARVQERTRDLQAEIAKRQDVEAKLHELNATLEQRIAERTETLRASEERYRMLMLLSPDGIIVTDNTGRLLACNEQCAQLHGYDHSTEMVGRHSAEFYTPEAFATFYGQAAAILQSGQDIARDIEAYVLRRDGSVMEVECSIARVPWPDAPPGEAFVASFRDVTKRREMLAELERHRSDLEELVQERTATLQAEIAERTAAQAALQRSEASLAAAERIARVGSWDRDLRTDEYHWAEEICRIFGLRPGDDPMAIRDGIWKAAHPEDYAAVEVATVHMLRTGEPFDQTYRIILPSSETRVLRGRTEMERDAEGRPVRLHGMVQDITEQEQIKEALHQRISELSSLQSLGHPISMAGPLEEIVDNYLARMVAVADLDMAQLFLLRQAQLHRAGIRARGGLQAAELESLVLGECLCGLAVRDGQLVYSGDIECDPRCTLACCRGAGLRSLAALPLRSGDTVIGALALGALAPDAFADRLIFLETAADQFAIRLQNALLLQEIRDRASGLEQTVAERTTELQTERDRTQAILDTVGESVVVTDLDGQVLFANPATLAVTGYPRDEVLGHPLWAWWTAQALVDSWPEARKAVGAGQAWNGEVTARRKTGALCAVEVTGAPLYDDRAAALPVGAVWVQRDITPFREAARLKDQFVSDVSHELRTPISIIALSCDNLETYHDRLDERQRGQLVLDIHEQSHVLQSLVENILLAFQIEGGHIAGTGIPVDLAQLTREEAERLRLLAEKRSQRLRITAETRVPVSGNQVQLRRVVRNLLDNAIKYTPAGGEISCTCEVRAGARAVDPNEPPLPVQSWAVVEVSDNGAGIAAEHLPLLFQRFFRAYLEGDVPGTGLGLPIAQELAQMHGGWITVASAPGQGSRFTVYLPLREEERA